MAGSATVGSAISGVRLGLGFVAGFLATLIFHQTGVEALHLVGMTAGLPYNVQPVPPFGVPAVLSLAFWGGIWGIAFAAVEPWLRRSPGNYWLEAILFGMIFPTLVGWFVVRPLKGLPVGAVFVFPGVLIGPIVNGLWGFGTAVMLAVLPSRSLRRAPERG
jgi:hypothetical protein